MDEIVQEYGEAILYVLLGFLFLPIGFALLKCLSTI